MTTSKRYDRFRQSDVGFVIEHFGKIVTGEDGSPLIRADFSGDAAALRFDNVIMFWSGERDSIMIDLPGKGVGVLDESKAAAVDMDSVTAVIEGDEEAIEEVRETIRRLLDVMGWSEEHLADFEAHGGAWDNAVQSSAPPHTVTLYLDGEAVHEVGVETEKLADALFYMATHW